MKKLMVLIAAIAMVGAFVATSVADVSLYGSARFRSYYVDVDTGGGAESDSDLEWRMGHLSRFGANFKSGKITGQFELDARAGWAGLTAQVEDGSGASLLGAMRLRHLWGQYDFGAGKIMIGHNFPLYDVPVSGINYYTGGLQKFGGMGLGWGPRLSQIRLTFGNLRFAFMTTDTLQQMWPLGTFEEANVTYPKIEARYDMRKEAFTLNFVAGWQTYEIEDRLPPTGSKETKDITSWVLGVRGKAHFGPVYANLGLTYRKNGQNYDAWTVSTKEGAVLEGNAIKDATAWGVVAALGWKINDMWTLEASHGSLGSEQDTLLDNEDRAKAWSLQAKITIAPGFYIYPELIYQDNENVINNGVSTDQGDITILGVYWRIDFK
jgi:hypothetical protein